MNILILIGLTIFLGTLGGKLCERFKIPQVTGYILVGFFLGKSVAGFWTQEAIDVLAPVVNLTLGIIGFMIGAELKFDVFKKWGRSIYAILFGEAFGAFLVVCFLVTLFTGRLYLGLFLGAIASATDPAATSAVLWNNKSRGPLTSTVLAVVALDDALALLIYGLASVFAKSLITHEHFSIVGGVVHPLAEIGIAILIGLAGGFILFWLIRFVIKDRDRLLPFCLGIVVIGVGVSGLFKTDLILSSMAVGMTFVNLLPGESKEILEIIKRFSAPIIILFFALVGARLDIGLFLVGSSLILILVYVISRSFGKVAGAFIGGVIGKAQPAVKKYLGLSLFSQGGVAIGLAISIYYNLSYLGPEASAIGLKVINTIVATTFVAQIAGPLCVKFAIKKSDEINRDVTEDDILALYKVADFVEKEVSVIQEDMPLYSIVETVKDCETESHHFCVVDREGKLLGTISLGDLKEIFFRQKDELNQLVLAKDIAVPAMAVIAASRPLKEAVDISRLRNLEFLPVVEDEATRKYVGIIHYHYVMADVQRKLLEKRGAV